MTREEAVSVIITLINQIEDTKMLEVIRGVALERIKTINHRNHILNNNLASNYDTKREWEVNQCNLQKQIFGKKLKD